MGEGWWVESGGITNSRLYPSPTTLQPLLCRIMLSPPTTLHPPPSTPFDWDAVIVGAGAAGLLAAIRAAERGRRVLLLEKGKKPGVKILISGGTRCNITHDCDARGIVAAFGPNGKFLHSALAALGPRETVALFESEGVATKIEETGKVFPVSNRAVDVLDALLRRLARSGATLSLNEPAREILHNP